MRQKPSTQRSQGRQRILSTIRGAGRIARIDIAAQSGLSAATVTALTSEMLDDGLIQEITAEPSDVTDKSKRGRPRVDLKLRGAAHKVAGLKVAQDKISALVLDFEGTELCHIEHPLFTARMSPEHLVREVKEAVEAVCKTGGFSPADLSGISIGLAGLIDAPRGFVHWSSSLSHRNVALGAMLENWASCPVFLDNDANLVAVAEQYFGAGRGISDFLVVTIEHGVGMGVVLNGQLHRGARGCAAEFGHTKVQLDGALCQCGQRGCLEAYISNYALIREVSIVASNAPITDVATVFAAAKSGDPLARSVLDRAGQMFAMGLANLVNIFDPEIIILAGAQTSFDHLLEDNIRHLMGLSVVQVDVPMPRIQVNTWGDLMWAKGAAAYGLDQATEMAAEHRGFGRSGR